MRWVRRFLLAILAIPYFALRALRLVVNIPLALISGTCEWVACDFHEGWHWPGWHRVWFW